MDKWVLFILLSSSSIFGVNILQNVALVYIFNTTFSIDTSTKWCSPDIYFRSLAWLRACEVLYRHGKLNAIHFLLK